MLFFDHVPAQFQAIVDQWNAAVYGAMAQIDAVAVNWYPQFVDWIASRG